jgi:hypothetical protein
MAELTHDPCCAPTQQARCCEPGERADCCGRAEGYGCNAGATPAVGTAASVDRTGRSKDGAARSAFRSP